MNSPYEGRPRHAFWRTGVAGQRPDAIAGLYRKKFAIDRSAKIATAGSCFAQHIARNLHARGFTVIDREPPPAVIEPELAARFGYGLYSARYGNIYTSRQLLQLAHEAFGDFAPADIVWEKGGRYYDAMRPSVEPCGLLEADAVHDHRAYHLRKVRQVIKSADVFVFTLGLTEAWMHAPSGTVYPTAPGTIAGHFDPAIHHFHNFSFQEIYEDFSAFFDLVRRINSDARFLLTVSPVPLAATASGEHVLAATVYSKSVLRAVAGQLYHERDDVDYFPSYEIVTSSLSQGRFYESNLRSVSVEGVNAAMRAFFAEHDDGAAFTPEPGSSEEQTMGGDAEDKVVCEDVLLDAFAR